ncbi:MAG TPA: GYD domain-containing protein [Candidatus Cybelea sp.]|nr:GYD domain-containing protein [Candidatus Cybelea sp.]
MPTYITLVNYTEQGIRTVKNAPARLNSVKKQLKDMGGELKAFYLTMGQFDIVTIVEAPDDETAAAMSLTIGAGGNVRTCTLKAFAEPEFRKIIKSLP